MRKQVHVVNIHTSKFSIRMSLRKTCSQTPWQHNTFKNDTQTHTDTHTNRRDGGGEDGVTERQSS